MGRTDKILSAASAIAGEPIERGALVAPPGSKAYRNVSGKSGYGAVSLAIGAVKSKSDGDHLEGAAGEFPKQFGLLGVTATRVVFQETKTLGGTPVAAVAEWPVGDVEIEYLPKTKGMRNPAVRISFADGTDLVAFGEPKWGIDQFA
ncbi:MAG: hypothetical protein ACE37B_21580 [Ilumatobacter sp.]|uniref:hypothetical protein n=1 Tax=Ilumatobacter sp. TaxID=1967498 RepID=UPI00391DAC0B